MQPKIWPVPSSSFSLIVILFKQQQQDLGNGRGTAGRAVAFNSGGLQFESYHQQIYCTISTL